MAAAAHGPLPDVPFPVFTCLEEGGPRGAHPKINRCHTPFETESTWNGPKHSLRERYPEALPFRSSQDELRAALLGIKTLLPHSPASEFPHDDDVTKRPCPRRERPSVPFGSRNIVIIAQHAQLLARLLFCVPRPASDSPRRAVSADALEAMQLEASADTDLVQGPEQQQTGLQEAPRCSSRCQHEPPSRVSVPKRRWMPGWRSR